jgi:arylsulfatase A-like enzyme
MFTGLHHVEHGVVSKKKSLAPGIKTLTESLKDLEYQSFGLYSSEWLKPEFGFGRGYDLYEMVAHRPTYADRIIRRAFEIIDEKRSTDRPFFLFLHFYDAHSDFVEQARSRLPYFSPSGYRKDLPEDLEDVFCNPNDECATSYLIAADRDRVSVAPDELRIIRDLYDRGVRCLSDDLQSLFSGLKERRIYDQAVILVTSDHGEEFREHGKFIHSQVYEESVAVPLLVKLPGQERAGERVPELMTLMNLHSMVLSMAGGGDPSEIEGTTSVTGGFVVSSRESVVFQDKLRKAAWGLRLGEWKLVRDRQSGATKLFRLPSDPGELSDLSVTQTETVQRLTTIMEGEIRKLRRRASEIVVAGADNKPNINEEEEERLRALGYVE